MKNVKILLSLVCLPLLALVIIYRWLISPLMPQCCRFVPTCSAYGLEALESHGILQGSVLTVRRILKCHPWGESGYDPVPTKSELKTDE